jgi:hypothetical protein
MWRVILAASMLLTLALGSLAQASPPPIVVETLTVEKEGAGTTMRFTARFAETFDESAFPETGTAVVMQVDGNRSKCLNVALLLTGVDGGLATYVGKFDFVYQGASVMTGRADIGGTIVDFSAPLDGTPGKIDLSAHQGSINGVGAPAIVTAPVTITPDPSTIDPRLLQTAAPQPQQAVSASQPVASLVDGLTSNTVALLGLIVVAVAIVSAYFDRKRSLARTTAS